MSYLKKYLVKDALRPQLLTVLYIKVQQEINAQTTMSHSCLFPLLWKVAKLIFIIGTISYSGQADMNFQTFFRKIQRGML